MAETNSNKTFTSNRHGKSVRLTFFPLNSQKEKLKMLNTLKKKVVVLRLHADAPSLNDTSFSSPSLAVILSFLYFFFPPNPENCLQNTENEALNQLLVDFCGPRSQHAEVCFKYQSPFPPPTSLLQ